jgi:hypothetical protein
MADRYEVQVGKGSAVIIPVSDSSLTAIQNKKERK